MSIFNDKALKSVAEAAAKVMQQEELKGNQHKIDANKNGKVDAHDFKLLRGKKDMKKEEVEQLDEVGDTPAGRKALGSYVNKAIDDKSKDRTKGLRKATSRMYKDNFYGKKNEEVEMNEEDAYNKDRYAVKNGKATKDNPTHMGSPNYKDQPHHVWATSAEHAMKKSMKKEDVQQLDEIGDTPAGRKLLKKVDKRAFYMGGTKRGGKANMADAGEKTLQRTQARLNKEEVDYLQESFADAVERVKAANGGKLPSGKPLAPKPKVKKDNTGRDYFGHDSVRQQSGYRGPGQSVLQTGADAIAKGAKAVGKAVKKSGIGKSVVGGIKAVKSAVKKTFSREEVEFIFNNFMLEDIQYFMISEEYEMLDESSREMFEYFFEEQSLNEGFPTVADAKKRMDAGKTATGSVTKTKTGLVHKRDYKDEDDADDAQKKSSGYGARQNYKRSTRVNEQLSFTEMLELYNEHGLKVLAPIETEEMDIDGTTIQVIDGDKINGYVETTVEEVTNDEFTKEFKDQQASFEGKKKQPKVAVGKTTGVKEMPESVELEERELSKDEAKKKEDYVKGMKKGLSGFKDRYGERAKSVMYATATKMAKKD